MKRAVVLLLLGLFLGPASKSEAAPEALVRFAGFDAGLREAVGSHQQIRLTQFPTSGGELLSLDLERFELTLSSTKIVLMTERGEEELAAPDIVILRGTVEDEPDSRVVLAILPDRVQGFVNRVGAESQVIVPSRVADPVTGKVAHQLRSFDELGSLTDQDLDALSGEKRLRCLVPPEMVPVPSILEQKDARKRATPRVCRIALECDYEYWDRLGGWEAALADIYAVMASSSVIYEQDIDVKLAVTFIRIWTIPGDPYSYVGGDITGLQEFQSYWQANHNPGQPGFVERDLAHLRSGRGVGAWGAVGAVCDYNRGFSISGGQGYSGAAGFLHDIIFVAHELGHNLGGIHTHCFNPPVDQCAVDNGCNQVIDCSTAPSTIMSYCDNCPGGRANILLAVAPENETLMLAHVGSSCIPYGRDPCYVDAANTGSEDGTVAHPYDTVEEGGYFVQPSGTVIIEAGNYAETVTLWQAMTLRAVNGSAVVGQ